MMELCHLLHKVNILAQREKKESMKETFEDGESG